ncbi:MAG: SURF1 family protein [Pseudomonadota bacterium]|nr:SURF1 family protein [Pseudomonadota bacterium]
MTPTRTRWRRPSLLSTLPFLLLIVLFLSAARWQWQRAEVKEQRTAQFRAAVQAEHPRPLSAALDAPRPSVAELVRIEGDLDRDRLILLDNRMRDGQYGVDVYALLHAHTGRSVLLGLGWVAADRSRRTAPVIPPLPMLVSGLALLTQPPASGMRMGAASGMPGSVSDNLQFPLLLSRIDIAGLRTALDLPGLPDRIAVLEADAGSGFVRSWQLPGLSADRHRGYALQWLSFAIGTMVFYILWHRPRKDSRP